MFYAKIVNIETNEVKSLISYCYRRPNLETNNNKKKSFEKIVEISEEEYYENKKKLKEKKNSQIIPNPNDIEDEESILHLDQEDDEKYE